MPVVVGGVAEAKEFLRARGILKGQPNGLSASQGTETRLRRRGDGPKAREPVAPPGAF